MSDPSAPSVILTGIANWLEWQDYIGRKLELATWAAIKTNDKASIIVEPNRPQISAFNSTDSSVAELTENQVNSYSLAWTIYSEDLDFYVKQQKQFIRACDIIYSSVDSRLARYLHWDHDIF
ncbi:copia-like retrotransposable element, partial [Metarhizium majus ARSEF 297]